MPTVLYVEDEEFDSLFMRRAFKKLGIENWLQVVPDGQKALDYLSGNVPYTDRAQYPFPQLVLLDLNLPVISGFEVLEWMKGRPACSSLPVVVFSSSARPEDRSRAHELGADRYLEKPASALEFPRIVETLKEDWLAGKSG